MRVLVVLERYPQLSETYISTELRALWPKHELSIIAQRPADLPQTTYLPYELVGNDVAKLLNSARSFRPDVIHGHYLHQSALLNRLAANLGTPYTIRTHSYDVLGPSVEQLRRWSEFINMPRCLGVLAFPFLTKKLTEAGIRRDKVHGCFPVVDFDRFHDPSPNLPGVMNVGAALPKKAMESYLTLATKITSLPVSLYPIGYETEKLKAINDALNRPVNIRGHVQHEDMPREYKRHTWLLYSASRSIATVGWPMAIAEAQAAGVGVCIEGIRPDLADYVGRGGYVLDRLSDALDIIAQPVPEPMRQAGFEQARLSDIRMHLGVLESLWVQ